MLKTLRIQNFKGWKDTGEITLAPITLFFGANSSGKSSIGQFLMMLKQTVESSDRKSAFFLGDTTNSHVQLGSYQDIVFQHKKDNDIIFSYSWNRQNPFPFCRMSPQYDPKNSTSDTFYFNAVSAMGENSSNPYIKEFQYCLRQNNTGIFDVKMALDKNGYSISSENKPFKRAEGRAWKLPATVRFYGFPEETYIYYQNAFILPSFVFEHENLFRRFYYLGPLRSKPGRIYLWSGNIPEGVGDSGENTIPAILAAHDRKINLGYKKNYHRFELVIADALKKLGLIDKFSVRSIAEGRRREYEVSVKTRGAEDEVLLPDVGFGVSQVLPVLVACYYAPKNSIIVMEQPEIHLHPSAQAALADVMIDVINSREDGEARNIQLLIETHSEHFLRRLQRRIAEDEETDEAKQLRNRVTGYFVDTTNHPVSLQPLDIDEFGNIRNWPKDFFGDEMGDISCQINAIARKQSLSNPRVPQK